VHKLARVRLSTGKVFRSVENQGLPPIGSVPGGDPPPAVTGTVLAQNSPLEARRPHFEFTGLGYKHLFVSPDHKEGIVEPTSDEQEENSVSAVTFNITNTAVADRTSKDAINVIGRIRFYSKDWSKKRDVPHGVWVGSPCDCTDIDVGEEKELILILVNGSDYATLRDLRADINKQYPIYFRQEDVEWFLYVRVKVTDQNSGFFEIFSRRIWCDARGWCEAPVTPPTHITDLPW
jgi:hypothetical protein